MSNINPSRREEQKEDQALIQLEKEIERLITENAELRSKIARYDYAVYRLRKKMLELQAICLFLFASFIMLAILFLKVIVFG